MPFLSLSHEYTVALSTLVSSPVVSLRSKTVLSCGATFSTTTAGKEYSLAATGVAIQRRKETTTAARALIPLARGIFRCDVREGRLKQTTSAPVASCFEEEGNSTMERERGCAGKGTCVKGVAVVPGVLRADLVPRVQNCCTSHTTQVNERHSAHATKERNTRTQHSPSESGRRDSQKIERITARSRKLQRHTKRLAHAEHSLNGKKKTRYPHEISGALHRLRACACGSPRLSQSAGFEDTC